MGWKKERGKKREGKKKRDTISPEFPSPPTFITSHKKSKLFILSHSFHSCLALLCQIQQIQKEWLRNTFSLSSPTAQVLLWMERALFALAKLHKSTKATRSARQEKSLPHSLQMMTKKVQGNGLAPYSRKGCWSHERRRGPVSAAFRETVALAAFPFLQGGLLKTGVHQVLGMCVVPLSCLSPTGWITPGAGNDAPGKEHTGTVPSAVPWKGAAAIVTVHHLLEQMQGNHCQDESLSCLLERTQGGSSLSSFCYLSLFFATEAVALQARDHTPEWVGSD